MNLNQIIKAYKAIQELSSIVLPYKSSHGVFMLRKRLNDEFDVIASMEKNLIDEYGGTIESDGSIKFPSDDTAKEFANKYSDMMEQSVDIELPKVDLSKCVDSINISADAMSALDGIIIFDDD